MNRAAKVAESQVEEELQQQNVPEPPPVEKLLKVDTLELEVGYGLVGLVDAGQGGDLLDRISSTRRQLALDLGLVMPPVRIRDNMQIDPHTYRVKIRGATIAEHQVHPKQLLAMDPGFASGPIEGTKTTEPAFGLDAWWIEPGQRQRAEALSYTVVEPTSVVATHIAEIVKTHADELLTREEVGNLIEQLKETAPKLAEEAIPSAISLGELQRVLQGLLRERVPIRDLESIVEAMAEWAPRSKDPAVRIEYARNALRRSISAKHAAQSEDGKTVLRCITLDTRLEDQVQGYVDRSGDSTAVTMPPRTVNRLAAAVLEALAPLTAAGHQPVILASPPVRGPLFEILRPHVPDLAVLGYNEIVPGIEIESMGYARWPEEQSPASQPAGQSSAVGAA